MNVVWQQLLDSHPRDPTKAESAARLFAGLNYQVQNGGFSQWVGNGYAQNSDALLRHLALMAKPGTVSLAVLHMVRTVVEYVDTTKQNRGCAGNYLKREDDRGWDRFSAACEPLDTRYYALNKEFEVEVEAYLATLPKE